MLHVSRSGDSRVAQTVACLLTEDPEPVALVRRQQDSRVARTRLRRNVLCRHASGIAQRLIGSGNNIAGLSFAQTSRLDRFPVANPTRSARVKSWGAPQRSASGRLAWALCRANIRYAAIPRGT